MTHTPGPGEQPPHVHYDPTPGHVRPVYTNVVGYFVPTSGLAVTALVLGIIGIPFVWLPFNILGILAVIFGGAAFPAINRGHRGGKGMAITGLVLGLVECAIWVLLLIVFAASPAHLGR